MFSALRASKYPLRTSATRAFSTSRPVASTVAKLTLVGRLSRDAEPKLTKNEKPYVKYTVVTSHPVLNESGEREFVPNFHHVLCFNSFEADYLSKLKKGTEVFVQANYSVVEPRANADPSTYQGQRHISLIHDNLKVLNTPRQTQTESESPEQTDVLV